jgi:hypothetical protein
MGAYFLFFYANWSVVAQSHTFLEFGMCTWADLLRSAGGNVRPTKCLHREGENGGSLCLACPTDRDLSASQSEDDINADIAEFFASRPLGIVELFVDPIVRMRIGSLIGEAMNRPTRLRRRVKLAKPRSAQ